MNLMIRWMATVGVAAGGLCPAIDAIADDKTVGEVANQAARLLEDSGLPGGMCVVVGARDASLPLALGQDGRFTVQALYADAEQLAAARETIRQAGKYGPVSADVLAGPVLPYASNLLNLVIVDQREAQAAAGISSGELQRVCAPLGKIYIRAGEPASENAATEEGLAGWQRSQKRWPDDIDQWTHYLHGPDGNPVAQDRVVGPPERYQWIGGPLWAQSHESDTNLRCLVTANGRIYYIVNEAPTSLAGPESPPDKWRLTARDAFNGRVLWQVPVEPWGWRQWKPSWFTPRPGVIPLNLDKRVVAHGDLLYATLGFRAPVSELDGRTGKILRTFPDTERTSEILQIGDSLVLTVLQDERAVVKRLDLKTGKIVWQTDRGYAGTTVDYYRFTAMRGRVPEAKVDPTLGLATDGKLVAVLDGDSVAGLDFTDGSQRWRTAFPLVPADLKAGNIAAGNRVWNGALIVTDGVVLHASPNQLAAFSAASGKVIWTQPKRFLQHLWYEWQDVFVIDGLVWTWSSEVSRARLQHNGGNSVWPVSINGYDLHSGNLQRQVPLGNIFRTHHHHRCYRNKATVRYVITSRRGSEFVDLENGDHSVNNWVRGACHMGMMPANGLQYAPPHPCQCYVDEKLKGFSVLSAEPAEQAAVATALPRRQLGPAFTDQPVAAKAATPADWPTFRSDAARSGFVHTELPAELQPLWQTAVGQRLGAPICVGDTIVVPLVDEHQIVAIRATDGKELWRFTAGARIDSPPTYDRGAVLFGSADGWVYRVRVSDGQLAWRLRGTAGERRIGAFGQLESAWPVHGSVLIEDGVVYFAAGRASQLDGGLLLVAADALTGELIRERTLFGPRYNVDNIEENYRLPMGLLPDVLRLEDGVIFMRGAAFDSSLNQQRAVAKLRAPGGLLDGAYFKRMPWSIGGSGHARVMVYDDSEAYGLRMFDSLAGLDPKVYFTPGKAGYLLFAHNLSGGGKAWEQRVPIRGRTLVVTDSQLCVAGPPDVIDPVDPLGAFEGRLGGVLKVVSKSDGQLICEHRLVSPPVFHGMAAARGRLILTLEDGSVACFGSR